MSLPQDFLVVLLPQGEGVMTSRRLLAVLSHPINPIIVGSVSWSYTIYRIQAINIDGPATSLFV